MSDPSDTKGQSLIPVARFPGLRALAWSGNHLYAGCGYGILRSTIQNPAHIEWQLVAKFLPGIRRRISVANRLSARLFRDGFHALAVLPSGGLIGAVPGSIVTLRPNEGGFRVTHRITRGTRPLHITSVPNGTVCWGEYFDNAARDEVHIYASKDQGVTWGVAYTFQRGAIRHVHNVVHDPWGDCLWIFTGDYGDECRILRASCDLRNVEVVMQGRQQARAVAAVPTKDAIYFSTDTPLESNFIYLLDRRGSLSQLGPISSSSINGCRVGNHVFFSTMVEPSDVNQDRAVRIYGADVTNTASWQMLTSWQKDFWPMGLFQYGNAFFPDGNNTTQFLAVSTAAVDQDDAATSIFAVNGM